MKMQKKTIESLRIVFVCFIISSFFLPLWASGYPEEVLKAKASIKGSMLSSHIDFLSSDYCRGRENGDYGMDVADKYITTVLSGAGVEGAGRIGSYFQNVKLKALSLEKGVRLEIEDIAAIATFPLVPLMTVTHALRTNLRELIKAKRTADLPIPRVDLKDFNQFIGMSNIEELQLQYLPGGPTVQISAS